MNWCAVNGRANFTELGDTEGLPVHGEYILVGICEQLPAGKSRLDGLAPMEEDAVWRERRDVEQNFNRAQKAVEHAGSMFSCLTAAFKEKVMDNEAVRIPRRCIDAALVCPSHFFIVLPSSSVLSIETTQLEMTNLHCEAMTLSGSCSTRDVFQGHVTTGPPFGKQRSRPLLNLRHGFRNGGWLCSPQRGVGGRSSLSICACCNVGQKKARN